jgi:TonB family protein
MIVLLAGCIFFDILAQSRWTKMRTLALVAIVTVCSLAAQELSHNTPPQITYKVEPEYSDEARVAGLEGAVVLRVVVDTDGKPRDGRVIRGLGLGLDEKAIAAVANWRFQPATKDGQPKAVQAQIEVNFRLLDSKWHLGRAEFHIPEGSLRPAIDKVKAPSVVAEAPSATATVTFDINDHGAPFNLQIEKASDEEWARNVTEALSKWGFTPASKDGHPVLGSCTMDFVRGNDQ